MIHTKQFFRNLIIFTLTSLLIFAAGIALGLGIVLIIKYLKLEYITKELVLMLWSLWWGLSMYSFLFELADGKYKFRLKMSFYTLSYGTGTYLALFRGEGFTSANLFAGTAILGLLLVITAPPFIEKYLKHKFIQRTR